MSVATFNVFHDERNVWHIYERARDASACWIRVVPRYALTEANIEFIESHSLHFCRECAKKTRS